MSDPGTRAILGIYLVTCLIVYYRETAIAAPSEEDHKQDYVFVL